MATMQVPAPEPEREKATVQEASTQTATRTITSSSFEELRERIVTVAPGNRPDVGNATRGGKCLPICAAA